MLHVLVFFVSRMEWKEPTGVSRRNPSQAVSPWFAQGVCATDILNSQVGSSGALVENRRDDGACMMGRTCQERCFSLSDADLSGIGKCDDLSGVSVELPVHVPAMVSVPLISAHSYS